MRTHTHTHTHTHTFFEHPLGKPLEAKLLKEFSLDGVCFKYIARESEKKVPIDLPMHDCYNNSSSTA